MSFSSKEFEINGKPRIISEASVDVSYFLFPDLDEWAKKEAGDDVILEFFARSIYPNLAACTQPMPSLQEAYNLNGSLDVWYEAVREVNPDTFDKTEFTQEDVEFSDGRKITVKSIRPSVILQYKKLQNWLEEENNLRLMKQIEEAKASKEKGEEYLPAPINERIERFRVSSYPMLAGCSFGDVPDYETALAMSASDKQLWYSAAYRHIPKWFMTPEQVEKYNVEMSKAEKKSASKPAMKS